MFEQTYCFEHSHCFGLCTADTASSCSISRFCTTADTSGLAAFRDSLLWILPVLQTVRVFVLRALHVLAVFRSFVLRALNTRRYCTKILSVCPVYSQYTHYTLSIPSVLSVCPVYSQYTHYTLSIPSILSVCPVYSQYTHDTCTMCVCTVSIIPCPLLCRKHLQMAPGVGVGANYFRWEQLEYFEYWPRFGIVY